MSEPFNPPKSIEELVKEHIAQVLGVPVDSVTNDARLVEDLKADSLDVIELIMDLEEAFSMQITDEEAEKVKTVQQAIDFVHSKVGSR